MYYFCPKYTKWGIEAKLRTKCIQPYICLKLLDENVSDFPSVVLADAAYILAAAMVDSSCATSVKTENTIGLSIVDTIYDVSLVSALILAQLP